MGKEPTFLVMHKKRFHNFLTRPEERHYLGCIHPITDEQLVYVGLAMGMANSLAIACHINNGALRQLREESELFQGDIFKNTQTRMMKIWGLDEFLWAKTSWP
jgi:hypothetical protein